MKKILLLSIAAISIFAADAQTKKSTKKAKKPTKEAVANAKFAKDQEVRKNARTAQLDSLKGQDEVRIKNDSLADVQKDSMRMAYRDAGMKMIDSTNKENYKAMVQQGNNSDKMAKVDADLADEAKLSDYETKQVAYINQEYNDKAKVLLQGSDAQQKKQELFNLNEERRSKIKTIVGKGKEKRLERDRKSYAQKNGAAEDAKWVDVAESYSQK